MKNILNIINTLILITGIIFFIPILIMGQCSGDNTFTGVTDSDWAIASNWSGDCVPTSPITGHIIISATCVYSSAVDITWGTGSTLQVLSDFNFILTYNLAWQCGDLLVYEGESYSTIQIGGQCWTAENLNVGTMVNGVDNQTNDLSIEKYCYGDIAANCTTYGALYQWDEMMQYTNTPGTQGVCPTGWHLPTNTEWTTLNNYLGDPSLAGGKMKEVGLDHWSSPNTGATNSSGFTAFSGGFRSTTGQFSGLNYNTAFWSSKEIGNDGGNWTLVYNNPHLWDQELSKSLGLSVRCVQD